MKHTGRKWAAMVLMLALMLGLIPGMGLTAYAVTADQSGENAYVKYFVGTKACYYQGFSVQGKNGDTWLSTTYQNEGYETAMNVDGTTITFDGFAYGKEYNTQGNVTAYITASVSEKSVLVTYTLVNNSNETKTVKIGSYGDAQIGSEDRAPCSFTGKGIRMTTTNGNTEFLLIPGDGNFTTRWYGAAREAKSNVFNNQVDTSTYTGDSGIAWSWEIEIPAGATVTKTAELSAGQARTKQIIYDANGGTGDMDPTVDIPGESIKLNKNTFTKDDCVFQGWDTDSAGKTVVYADEAELVMPDADKTLYAVWKEIKEITAAAEGFEGAYDGKEHGITVTVTDPSSGATIKYGKTAGTYDLDASPTITNVVDSPLTVYFKVTADGYKDYTGSATVTINKANAVPATVTANTLTYTGSAQALVSAGTAEGGEMQYALGDANGATQPYTTSIPTATDVGTYFVWYKLKGDGNHVDSTAQCTAVSIIKANVAPTAPDDENGLVYNGKAQALMTKGSVTGGTLQYALGTSATSAPTSGWSTTVPTAKDAGTYHAWYRVVGDANHNGVDPVCLTVTLQKQPLTITAEDKSKIYGQSDPALTYKVEGLVSGDSLTGALKRSAGEYVGNYTIGQGTLAAPANYAVTYNAGRFTISQAEQAAVSSGSLSATTASSVNAKDGAISGVESGMEYSPDGGNTWIPIGGSTVSGLKAGDYLVRRAETRDRKASPATKVTVPGTKLDKSAILIATLMPAGDDGLDATWTTVKGVDGYDVYMTDCGSDKLQLVASVPNSQTSYSFRGLRREEGYKVCVKAFTGGGSKTVVATSPLAHCYTTQGTKKINDPGSLTLTKPTMTIRIGKSAKIKAIVKGLKKKGKLLDHDGKLRYINANPDVVEVLANGKVTAKAPGTATIYVLTSNGIWKTVTVNVDANPTKIKLGKGGKNLSVGGKMDLGARVILNPVNAVTSLTWSSSNPAVATVDANGKVTAHAKGKATITVYTANKHSAKVRIVVR